jgi:UDP-3-O-[3-hydroxymyristoyl] glucosamine N-acyltransferase
VREIKIGLGIEILAPTSNFDIESILSDLEVGYQVIGSRRNFKRIRRVAAIDEATPHDLTFSSGNNEKAASMVSKSNAGIILCKRIIGTSASVRPDQLLVLVDNPRLVFMHITNRLHHTEVKRRSGKSESSCVSDTAKINRTCTVGNFSVIDEGCVIGKNTIIGDRVSLQNCVIGDNCMIQSGVSIGEDGFAFERNDSLELEPFPHFGKVIIGNDVEIQTNCSIARGSLKDTIIEDGTKIDALVHVAHNVNIGKNCSLTAGTIIGGSTTIGDTCWLGLNSTVKHKLRIGNKVIIGSGASVIDNIPDEDIVAGIPAKSISRYRDNGRRQYQITMIIRQI